MNRKKLQIDNAFLILACDVILINLATVIAILLAKECYLDTIITDYGIQILWAVPIITIVYVSFSYFFGVYRIMWAFAGFKDTVKLVLTIGFSTLIYYAIHTVTGHGFASKSVYAIGCMTTIILFGCVRLFIRYIMRTNMTGKGFTKKSSHRVNVMLIGAGSAASLLIKDIQNNSAFKGYVIKCIIDDDKAKIGRTICGQKIVGDRHTIVKNAIEYDIDTIIFAIPTMGAVERANILNLCSKTRCSIKVLPSINQIVDKSVNINNLREIRIEDLLGREPVKVNIDKIIGYVSGKTILVTGGGGSIGSELCRQIAANHPKQLIIFDMYENNAYDIQMELRKKYPELNLVTLIGSVRDTKRLNCIFSKYRPNIVYHAAAHKHVPLMEDSPNEAIKNNVLGTYKTMQAADRYKVERFVLISTDKAVNPTNVMGATKRMCEMLAQMLNRKSKTDYVTVRFGNVLGSNGSVIPLFKKQIADGGPVTVTDPNVIRYFMTIEEAVSLVIEAGAIAKGGEIFILDMGNPVRILDLAVNLIRLSGFKPYEDIEIKFTGMRPGEKMYEEILMNEEGITKTDNDKIFIGQALDFDADEFEANIEHLRDIMMDDKVDMREEISKIVPTYRVAKKVTV